MGGREVILTSNGPGELYTWVRPVLAAWRAAEPSARVSVALVPCQFASGGEARVALTFDADHVTSASEFRTAAALGRAPAGLRSGPGGLVLALGGHSAYALWLARRLKMPAFGYSFHSQPARGLTRLFVPEGVKSKPLRWLGLLGQSAAVEEVGNLVADAVEAAEPVAHAGSPHILLLAGSRDAFARLLIPFILAVADQLIDRFPHARFIWPLPSSLSPEAVRDGVAGVDAGVLGGMAGDRRGDRIHTPKGAVVEIISEHARYAHMRCADVALTIPGTNTLELGIAGVPSVVMLPLNRPEVIPLEGAGHWLSLIPVFGVPLKRRAVRLFVERLRRPVSLPNRLSGEALMLELTGRVDPVGVSAALSALLEDPERRHALRQRMHATMPAPGAAARLVARLQELLPSAGSI